MVAQVALPARLVQRPRARVEGRQLDARLRLAGREERAPLGVVGEGREVVEPVERLDEAVDDVQAGSEGVLQVVRAGRRVHAHALGRRGAEDPQRGARGLEVARLVQARRRAREGLKGGALREAADPRRSAVVEVEERLPGDAAGARGGQAERLVEQGAQLVVAARLLEEPVGAPEGAQPLDLDPLPGVVLPHELAAGEHHALAVAQQRARRPPGAVALQREEDERGAGGGEQAGRRDCAGVGDHGVELAPARAVELVPRRLGVVVGLGPRVVVKLVDGAGGEQRVELGGHGARRLGVGGHRGEQDREHRREQGNRRAPHGADRTVARSRSMQVAARLGQ